MNLPSNADRQDLASAWAGSPLASLDPANASGFDAGLLAYLRGRQSPHFYFDHQEAAHLGAAIAAHRPEQAKWVLDRADHARAHRFPAADEEHDPYVVQLGERIDWYNNPTVEPQFIFTLNRHRFWQELAMAHRFTGDNKYIDELQSQIVSWCEQSPPLANPDDWQKFPQCWWLLDAAVRADTWIWTIFLSVASPAWRPEVNTLFVHRLLAHARLLRHLTPRTGTYWAPNWLIMQAQGLLNIALMFPEFAESAEWAEHSLDVLSMCADAQFFADGGHCEQSPIYHEYCLRWLAEPLYLARKNGVQGSDDTWSIIEKACEFHYQMIMPDGSLPALSDGDRNSAGILTQMGIFFKHPEWMRYRAPSARDCWFFGAVPAPGELRSPAARPNAVGFAESGYFVMRSGDTPECLQLVFDCGITGGGHGHYDLLTFDLYGHGRPLIPDPGRLVYDDSPDRHWVLGTPSHNTISLDGQNHARLERDESRRIHLAKWEVGDDHVLVSGWHEGYKSLDGAPRVGRTIWFDRRSKFVIADWVRSDADHDATVSFTLAGSDCQAISGGGFRTGDAGGNVLLQPMLRPGQSTKMEPTFHSPNYGIREPAVRVTINERASRTVFVTVVHVLDAASGEPTATAVRIEDGNVHFRDGESDNAVDVTLRPPFDWK